MTMEEEMCGETRQSHGGVFKWTCMRERHHGDGLHYFVRQDPEPRPMTRWQRFTKRLHNRRRGHLAVRLSNGGYECPVCLRQWGPR